MTWIIQLVLGFLAQLVAGRRRDAALEALGRERAEREAMETHGRRVEDARDARRAGERTGVRDEDYRD